MSGHRSDSRPAAPTNSDWQNLLARFPEASQDLVARRNLRRRTDSKFVLSPSSAAELVGALGGHMAVLAAGTELVAEYRTLYFDTPELDFFHAHRCGHRVRHKVRIRHYPDRRLTFLEVKTRRNELRTTKARRELPYAHNELSADDRTFIHLHTGIRRGVLPQVWTYFRRLTLVGLHTNERVTVDLDLGMEMGARTVSIHDLAIVEVKQSPFCRFTPVMLALRAAGVRPGWTSKYCTAIAFTRPEVRRNRLMPGLRAFARASG